MTTAVPGTTTANTPRRQASYQVVTFTFNPASVAANTTAEQDVTVSGLALGDHVAGVNKPTLSAGLGIVGARVKAANTLAITFVNATGSAIDAGSETYTVGILRQSQTTESFDG